MDSQLMYAKYNGSNDYSWNRIGRVIVRPLRPTLDLRGEGFEGGSSTALHFLGLTIAGAEVFKIDYL